MVDEGASFRCRQTRDKTRGLRNTKAMIRPGLERTQGLIFQQRGSSEELTSCLDGRRRIPDPLQLHHRLIRRVIQQNFPSDRMTRVTQELAGMRFVILQLFYNYLVSKIDSLVNSMEDASITLVDILVKNQAK